MGDFIGAMGVMSIPLIISSIVAVVVILSLFLTLRKNKVLPDGLTNTAQKLAVSGKVQSSHIQKIKDESLLGRVLAAGLENIGQPRHVLKENIEEAGRHVAHSMDKYMTTLGTIAAIAPLLGLLGTVVGMIEVFSVITAQGVGNPTELAGGISKALLTTAFGIGIAVPALIFHRYFRGKINDYAVEMEKSAIRLVTAISAPHRRAADIKQPMKKAVKETASEVMGKRQKIAKQQAALRGGQVA